MNCCDQSCQVQETGPTSSTLAACCSQHRGAHGCCCNSAEESHHAGGRSKVKQKFLIKDVIWEGVVTASTVERKVVNWMVMKDYSKKVLLPPDIIILVSSSEARSIQFTKTFKTDYSLQFILRSATHPNTQSGFDKGPAFTGLVIFSRDGKQTDVLKKLSACRLWGSQAHFRMAWGSKGTDTTGDWQKAWLEQKPCS